MSDGIISLAIAAGQLDAARDSVVASWAGAVANFAVVVVTAWIATITLKDGARHRAAADHQRHIAGWISAKQVVDLIDALFVTLRENGDEPLKYGWAVVVATAAKAAAHQGLSREIPHASIFNLAVHAQTLAISVADDLEQRRADAPLIRASA